LALIRFVAGETQVPKKKLVREAAYQSIYLQKSDLLEQPFTQHFWPLEAPSFPIKLSSPGHG
jgi:hypothetical protein